MVLRGVVDFIFFLLLKEFDSQHPLLLSSKHDVTEPVSTVSDLSCLASDRCQNMSSVAHSASISLLWFLWHATGNSISAKFDAHYRKYGKLLVP